MWLVMWASAVKQSIHISILMTPILFEYKLDKEQIIAAMKKHAITCFSILFLTYCTGWFRTYSKQFEGMSDAYINTRIQGKNKKEFII